MTSTHSLPKFIARYTPFDSFSEQQRILAAAKAEIREFTPGQIVVDLGNNDRMEYFLLHGTVELESFDGRFKQFDAESDTARTAVALLQPRKYRVKALTHCTFFVLPLDMLKSLVDELPKQGRFEFSVRTIHDGTEARDILRAFEDDLRSNNLQLPSFPDVASKIRHLMENPNVTACDIADVLNNDPPMTVKLIRACNSPLYRAASEITSSLDAVVRLGFDTTRQLVTIFSLREVFRTTHPRLKSKIGELWTHSTEVAAMAHALAAITPGVKAELGMLAGLIQDIGAVPVLNYLERYPHIIKMDQRIDETLHLLKSRVGAKLLEYWGFQETLVNVARHSEDWRYASPGTSADYTDICIVAQLHSFIGKKQQHRLPPFGEVPAFGKLGRNGLTPEQSAQVLSKSREEISNLQALLNPSPVPTLR
jgi:HD-like signal output (HDOD) protein